MVHSAHYGAGPAARRHGAGAGLRPGAMVLLHHGTWCIDGAGTLRDDDCLEGRF